MKTLLLSLSLAAGIATGAAAQEYANTLSLHLGSFSLPATDTWGPALRPFAGASFQHQFEGTRFSAAIRYDRWTLFGINPVLDEPAPKEVVDKVVRWRKSYQFADLSVAYSFKTGPRLWPETFTVPVSLGVVLARGIDNVVNERYDPKNPPWEYGMYSETVTAMHAGISGGAGFHYRIPSSHIRLGIDSRLRLIPDFGTPVQCYTSLQVGYAFGR